MSRDERLREEQTDQYKLFVCVQCGFEYDEEKGWPEDGIAPGTRWDDIPRGLELSRLRRGQVGLRDDRSSPYVTGLGERSDGKISAWGERRRGQ